MNYKEMKECLACGVKELNCYLDLGMQPLANLFHTQNESLDEYPLAVNFCKNCYHSQLTVAVNPDLLFRNYLYVSGTTKTLNHYFINFVDKVEGQFPGQKLNVLEIASNDGSLLEMFKNRGHAVQGVDPAMNLQKYAKEKGVPTLSDYWNAQTATKLEKKYDVIIAMNVLAHISNPSSFLDVCKSVLKTNGVIYLQMSQAEIFKKFEFDTVYHEHHSFFTCKSFVALCDRSQLKIIDVEKTPIHGVSYLFSVGFSNRQDSGDIEELLSFETKWGFYDPSTYKKFGENAKLSAINTNIWINKYKSLGYKIIGYGAAAKGNTFLNYAKIDLDFIIDDNPLKVELFSPGRNIIVKPMSYLEGSEDKFAILILAWNFFDEIKKRLSTVRKGTKDICCTYFPEIRWSTIDAESVNEW